MRTWDPELRCSREHPLEELPKIREIAQRVLTLADIRQELPTPIEPIARVLGLIAHSPNSEKVTEHIARLSLRDAENLNSARKKTVGWKFGSHYGVHPWAAGPRKVRKAAFHEMGHQALPWHHLPGGVVLDPSIDRLLDAEANAFAHEMMFQGGRFEVLSDGMPSTFDTVKRLADMFEAPWQDALIRMVERRREPLALIVHDGNERHVVAAAASAIAAGLDDGISTVETSLLESVDLGLPFVGSRRFELVRVTAVTRLLRLVI